MGDLNAGKNVDEATPQRYRRATPCPEICVDYCKMLAKKQKLALPIIFHLPQRTPPRRRKRLPLPSFWTVAPEGADDLIVPHNDRNNNRNNNNNNNRTTIETIEQQ